MKEYNEKKICFIICTNDKQYLEECLLYLSLLEIPEGYETELLTIEDAKSMAAGYNEGMNSSDAKYKIYLHQDTFITEKKILEQIVRIFQSDKNIGMLGTIGSEKLSKDGVMWHGERCGDFYRLDELNKKIDTGIKRIDEGFKKVEVIDGLFMATQYDIPWREDILDGWDFYDVSQCFEFRRAGYKVIIPAQRHAWVIHACGAPGYWQYNKYREKTLANYPEIGEKREYLRILWFRSKEIGLLGIPYSLQAMGHEVTISTNKVSIKTCDERAVEFIEEWLEEGNYDLVMSYDFSPSVAQACSNSKVKYWSWVYDSPLLELYTDEAKLPYIYISVFDKKQYERLKPLGFYHLFYVPLATEVSFFGMVDITEEDEQKYKADVSFVGRLYDKRGVEELFDESHKDMFEEVNDVANSCNCTWDENTSLYGRASEKLINYMISKENEEIWNIYKIDKKYFCESLRLARKCNEIERIRILNALAEKYDVILYSDNTSNEQLHNIKICPWVDYWNEMPKVFYMSKINLNITSRSIESGVPQRVFDIMAVGGFCLTNYQVELEEYFEIGKDLVVYHNLEELMAMVDYYLKHEEERIRIAMNGYKKVKEKHSYRVRIEQFIGEVLN